MNFVKLFQFWFFSEEVSKLKHYIRKLELEVIDLLFRIRHPRKFHVSVSSINVTSIGDIYMALTLKNTEAVVVTAAVLDAAGSVVSGSIHSVFSSSDETVLTVVAAADGQSAVVTTTGKVGVATVIVDVEGFTASLDFTVVGSGVASVTLTAGVPFSRLPVPTPVPAPVIAE